MTGFRPERASKAKERLARKGIAVRTSTPIVHVKPEIVHFKSGEALEASTIVWTGGIRAVPIVAQSSLATAYRGRGTVDQFLRSVSDPSVFIVGDSAYATDPATGAPLAPSAQLAVKQGEYVGRLIHSTLLGLEPLPFAPGKLPVIVSLGVDYALADFGWLVLRGQLARALKRISVVRYLYGLCGIGLALPHAPEVLEGVPIIGTPPGRLAA